MAGNGAVHFPPVYHNHYIGGALSVDRAGDWRPFVSALPSGAVALGVVTRTGTGPCGYAAAGALVKFRTGLYCQVNKDLVRLLPQAEVRALMEDRGPDAA